VAILVARQGATRREQVSDSADALRQVNARIFGTVLDFAPVRKRRKYGWGHGYSLQESGDKPA
jgi:non-specific protein-tyrosine kinase